MARGSRIYKVKLLISDMDRHCYEQLDLTVAQHPSESEQRLLARLIAFGLEYEPGLAFGGGVSTSDEAPVWLRNDFDEVQHWIDIGQPDPERLAKLAKRYPKLSLYCYGANSARWWHQHQAVLAKLEQMKVVLLDAEVISRLTEKMSSGFELQLTQQDGVLFISMNDVQAQLELQSLQSGWQD